MTKKGQHPWPTDGVTKRQLDRHVDRIERILQNRKEQQWALQDRVSALEAALKKKE